MADRKRKKRESKGAYWMDTYGDMVTLLLTFFIMLFASSQMSETKWMRIVESFTGEPASTVVEPIDPLNPTSGFTPSDYIPRVTPRSDRSNDQDSNLKDGTEQQEYSYEVEAHFSDLYNKLTQYIEENNLQSAIVIEKDENGQYIYVTILEGILFDSGQAEIRDETAEQILKDLGDLFMSAWDSIQLMMIEGHTDNVPINTYLYKNNRFLSSARANEVLLYMQENSGIPNTSNVKTEGLGATDPIAPNDTEEGKQQNRRVEFILESTNAIQ